MTERDAGSSWLLSDEARPKVERPTCAAHEVRVFRMPSCIGQPASYGLAEGTPPPELAADGRFRDRTLAWFSDGELRARDECARYEVQGALSRRRTYLAIAVAAGAFAVGALLTSAWLSS